MSRKLVPFPNQNTVKLCSYGQTSGNQSGTEQYGTNEYISSLRAVSKELQQLAGQYNISVKEVFADFSYIIIGDEIVTTLLEDEIEE